MHTTWVCGNMIISISEYRTGNLYGVSLRAWEITSPILDWLFLRPLFCALVLMYLRSGAASLENAKKIIAGGRKTERSQKDERRNDEHGCRRH